MRAIHKAIKDKVLRTRPMPHTLLDIGCGNGAFTQVLAEALPGTSITAIDTKVSKRVATAMNITFTNGSAEALPFAPESFDVVVTALSLHHWKDKGKGVCEAYRVLKKGGRVIIGDPLLEGWLSNPFWGRLAQLTDGGTFTDARTLTASFDEVGFSHMEINLVPNLLKALYIITAKKE